MRSTSPAIARSSRESAAFFHAVASPSTTAHAEYSRSTPSRWASSTWRPSLCARNLRNDSVCRYNAEPAAVLDAMRPLVEIAPSRNPAIATATTTPTALSVSAFGAKSATFPSGSRISIESRMSITPTNDAADTHAPMIDVRLFHARSGLFHHFFSLMSLVSASRISFHVVAKLSVYFLYTRREVAPPGMRMSIRRRSNSLNSSRLTNSSMSTACPFFSMLITPAPMSEETHVD